jgi:hypothetical protein
MGINSDFVCETFTSNRDDSVLSLHVCSNSMCKFDCFGIVLTRAHSNATNLLVTVGSSSGLYTALMAELKHTLF